jgi:hypothetical protein
MSEIENAVQDNTAAATSETVETTQVEQTAQQTNETATVENTSTETTSAETEEAKTEETKPTIPESYEDFSLPEGMEYDQASSDNFKAVAKELGLSQEAAQKLVSFQTDLIKAQQEAQTNQMNSWRQESEKSIGKDGIEQANRALAEFTSPEFIQYLNDTGLGNHPALIKTFQKVYDKIGESSFVDNNSSGTVSLRNDYSKLYPSMKDFYK